MKPQEPQRTFRYRTNPQVLADRAKVSNLYLRGEALHSIAAIMGVPYQQVRKDLLAIRRQWQNSAMFDFGLARQQELARIDMVETEAWRAWETSKAPLETTNTRQRRRDMQFPLNNGDPARMPMDSISEANRRSVQRDPNPAFLERVAWCVEMRCKILGLIAPQELRHSGTLTTIKEIHYQPSVAQGESAGRLVILGGPNPALPTATPSDLARPDDPYDRLEPEDDSEPYDDAESDEASG